MGAPLHTIVENAGGTSALVGMQWWIEVLRESLESRVQSQESEPNLDSRLQSSTVPFSHRDAPSVRPFEKGDEIFPTDAEPVSNGRRNDRTVLPHLTEDLDKLVEGAADVIAIALHCFYLSPSRSQSEHGQEVPTASRTFQLPHRGRTEMRLSQDANHPIDLSVSPDHARSEPSQDDEPIAQSETAGARKIPQRGLDYNRLRSECVPQRLKRHAWITGMAAVVLSKKP
jgi:hypothetical protein